MPSWSAFPSAPALGSAGSAPARAGAFVGFPATMAGSDFSLSCITGFGSSPSRCGPDGLRPVVEREISRFPCKERPYMPGSQTTRSRSRARAGARDRVAFRWSDGVGAPIESFRGSMAGLYNPCRRFAPGLAADGARLGADAVRYSFIAVDSHHLLLAGLPAHLPPILARCLPIQSFSSRWLATFLARSA